MAILSRVLLLALLLLPSLGLAQQGGCPGLSPTLTPLAFEEITVSTVAVGLTVNTIGAGTNVLAYLTITGGPINYVFIGTPTATVGHEFDSPTTGNAGSTSGTWICGTQLLLGFRAIRQSTTDAKLHVTYFRQ